MPLSSTDRKRRDHLVAAAETCRQAGRPDQVEAIDYVLSPKGAEFVTRLRRDSQDVEDNRGPSLSLGMREEWRDQLKAAAAAAGNILSADVTAILAAFVNGQFEPKPLPRATGGKRVNLVVRIPDADLVAQVHRMCGQAREGGDRLYLVSLAIDGLLRKYKVGPYAPKAKK
ncbi:hypothetical protein AB0D12_31525 [Streptomyces sp. NPDC048479]|uniref:hypothetical protein n=1 Tax=Streptomyces sp. NPDC048479 TaxID=3154725 RepID=UPI00342DAE13